MKKVLFAAILAALSLGCAVTNYPVITDDRGADDDGVMFGQYDLALVKISQVATIWSDGTDELFTLLSQDWTGDQWLKTFNNFDPSGSIMFLNHLYCDPNYDKTQCPITVAWNPDIAADNVFDYTLDLSCSGARSLSTLVNYTSRYYGECGSGFASNRQALAYEFSQLGTAIFQGKQYYHIPFDNSTAALQITGQDGVVGDMQIYGRFNMYLDAHNRLAVPMTPNARYQLRAFDQWIKAHGHSMDIAVTYGSLTGNFAVNITTVQNALDRL